jgi:uncharacterized membrane protein YvbJ
VIITIVIRNPHKDLLNINPFSNGGKIMMCPKCGVMVDEGTSACPNCGTPVQQLSSYDQVVQGQGSGYSALKTREMDINPLAILTIYMPISWIFCPVAGICILAGIITIATNLK